jgi:hypothetical protein
MASNFDGVDDKLECADESAFDWERTSPMSFAGWIKILANVDEAWLGKANTNVVPPQRGFALNTVSPFGPTIDLHLVNAVGNHFDVFAPDGIFQPFFWVHVGITYDGSLTFGGAAFYRNGVLVTGTTSNVNINNITGTILTDNPLRVAGHDTGGGEFWQGAVAGVAADNVQWTAAEVAALAKLSNFHHSPAGLLTAVPELWLPIFARAGDAAFDLNDYANNHDATIVGAPTVAADPEVVLDWTSTGANTSGRTISDFTTTVSFTHSPGAALQGVLVLIAQNVSSADLITSVTYGGVAMTRITNGFAHDTATEPGAVYAYLLGSSVPTGDQTVTITVASGTDAKRAWVFGVLASGDVVLIASGIAEENQANPSVTLATVAGYSGMVFSVLFSGLPNATDVTAGSGYAKISPRDFGAQVAMTEAGNKEGANVVAGWTSATDDVAMISLALGSTKTAFRGQAAINHQDPAYV